jgi:glycosyltransferase involved in cell wall biosynthesis
MSGASHLAPQKSVRKAFMPRSNIDCHLLRPSYANEKFREAYRNKSGGDPLVSCIMVTRGVIPILRHSVECYRRQTYAERELIVVCDNHAEEVERYFRSINCKNAKVVRVPAGIGLTLGDLRNIGISRAQGQLIAQWDDDDLSDPNRLAIAVRVLCDKEIDVAGVFLSSWVFWWPARRLICISTERAWEGTMVAWRGSVPVYPAQRTGEDTFIVDHMSRAEPIALLREVPWLYVYACTGRNSFDENHFEHLLAKFTKKMFRDQDYADAVQQLEQRIPILEYAADL